MVCNPIASVNFGRTETRNGQVVSSFGINFPKGASIACGGIKYTKDGVAEILSDYDCTTAVGARLVGLADALLTTLVLPFALVTYVVIMLLAIVSWLVLFPAAFCFPPFWTWMKMIGILAILSPLSMIVAVVLAVLSYFQFIVPELTCFVLQIHKWGKEE